MADLSINSFKANFLGGARPSLYAVEMTFPNGVTNSVLAAKKTQFLCKAAAIPADTINSFEIPYMSRKIPVPGDRTFSPITLTIINDTDWVVRNAFEEWCSLINTHEGNIGNTSLASVTTDFNIKQLNRDGSIIKTYKLVSAFPSEVSDITLGYGNTDEIEEWQATIHYAYWQTETIL